MRSRYVVLIDPGLPETAPLSRFRSIFAMRDGIYSPLARARIAYPDAEIVFFHPAFSYEKAIVERERLGGPASAFQDSDLSKEFARTPSEIQSGSEERGIVHVRIAPGQIFQRMDAIAAGIENDLPVFLSQHGDHIMRGSHSALQVIGPNDRLFVQRTARILPGVIFNTEEGPIVIDSEAKISPFSYLSGPLYVGPGAQLDHVKIGNSIVGEACRLGGEIESSIFGDFTNKHHEGFVGHSLIGSWVNLGALSTTSDLKNNYGKIRLRLPAASVETGRIKFGSILGDCVKTAIGTMINTGSVLDAGCNVFGGRPPAYLSPLSWGIAGERYEIGRFIRDCETIFARRKQNVPAVMRELSELAVSLDGPAGPA